MSRIAPPLGLPSPAEEGAGATAVEAEAREDPSRCGGMGESTDGVIAEDGDFTSESTSSEGAGALLVDAAAIVAGAESSCCSVGADDGSTHDPQGAAFGLESWSQQPRPLANHFCLQGDRWEATRCVERRCTNMALAAAGTAFSLVSNAKRAVDLLKQVHGAPDEARFLRRLVDGMVPVLAVAREIGSRECAIGVVGPALDLWAEVLGDCARALERIRDDGGDGDGDDGSGSGGGTISTSAWMSQRDAITALSDRVAKSQGVLHLCLSALAFKAPGFHVKAPFRFIPSVVMRAHDLLLEFEFGRRSRDEPLRLCFGSLARRTRGSSVRRSGPETTWEHLAHGVEVTLAIDDRTQACLLSLTKPVRRSGAKHASASRSSPESDSESDGEDKSLQVRVDMATTFRRLAVDAGGQGRGADAFMATGDAPSYQIDRLLLSNVERIGDTSLELFEALVHLCRMKVSPSQRDCDPNILHPEYSPRKKEGRKLCADAALVWFACAERTALPVGGDRRGRRRDDGCGVGGHGRHRTLRGGRRGGGGGAGKGGRDAPGGQDGQAKRVRCGCVR